MYMKLTTAHVYKLNSMTKTTGSMAKKTTVVCEAKLQHDEVQGEGTKEL